MITRFLLVCAACGDEFVARIEILPSALTRLAFPCPICEYIIRGRYSGITPEQFDLKWENCSSRDFDERLNERIPDLPITTVGTGVPLLPTARELSEFGGGPNITFGELIGDNLWATNHHHRMHQLSAAWKDYDRLLHYYLSKNWRGFETLCGDFFNDLSSSPMGENERHIRALRPAQELLVPLLPGIHGARMLSDYSKSIKEVKASPRFASWVTEPERAEYISNIHRQLFSALQQFVRAWESWSSGVIVRATPIRNRPMLADLRLSRDEFSILRDIYVLVYERCFQALPIAMSLLNTQKRGDPDSFGSVPAKVRAGNARTRSPRSLREYDKLPNAIKLPWFDEWPAWRNFLPSVLDRQVRNSIGHADAEHNIVTGRIVAREIDISYLDLTAATMDLGQVLLVLLQVTKTVRLLANETVSGE